MRADSFSVLDPAGPGRKAVRIKSNAAYSTHVTVYAKSLLDLQSSDADCDHDHSFDIRHMPQGCGTWPAAWEVNEEAWPGQGEVDIVRP